MFMLINYIQANNLIGTPFITNNANLIIITRETDTWKWAIVFYEMAVCSEFVITIVYWTGIFPGSHENKIDWVFDLGIHALPLLLLMVDFLMNTIVFPIRHFLVVLLMVSWYLCWNYLLV